MAQSVKHPTLGFGSGCDLRAVGSNPLLGSMLSTESAKESLSVAPLCKTTYIHLNCEAYLIPLNVLPQEERETDTQTDCSINR